MAKLKLDDLYFMVANIYSEQNYQRSESKTFAHFVEVCGMLTAPARGKTRNIDFESALCKALGWFFPLMAKCKVKSIEKIIFRKYPLVCPYCRLSPHAEAKCKTIRGWEDTTNHKELRKIYQSNLNSIPVGLNDWQKMFQEIYQKNTEEKYRSTVGLFEELGELAEAIRVYDIHPQFFAGEAADVFSYLMGIANEYSLRIKQSTGLEFDFEGTFIKKYPGICVACGNCVCSCPAVPSATIGRMAKELPIDENENLFGLDISEIRRRGSLSTLTALTVLGGYSDVMKDMPFDRGQLNQNLVLICLAIASELEEVKPIFAKDLREIAGKIGLATTEAGTSKRETGIQEFLNKIKTALTDSRLVQGPETANDYLIEKVTTRLSTEIKKLQDSSKSTVIHVHAPIGMLNTDVRGTISENSVTIGFNAGDLNGLIGYLTSENVKEDEIKELVKIIKSEGAPKSAKMSEKIAAWVGKMTEKGITGAWDYVSKEGPGLLLRAIKIYYGISDLPAQVITKEETT